MNQFGLKRVNNGL